MMERARGMKSTWQALLELALCLSVFAGFAFWPANDLSAPRDLAASAALSAIAFWLGQQWGTPNGASDGFLQGAVVGVGQVLVADSLMAYAELATLSFFSTLAGCVVATLLIAAVRVISNSHTNPQKALLLGYGASGRRVANALGPKITGLIAENSAPDSQGITYLGGVGSLTTQVLQQQPSWLIADLSDWQEYASPRFLLDCKLNGITMESAASVEERLMERIPVEAMRPGALLWSEAMRANRRMMALQAIYANLIGLSLLVLASPILVIGGLAARLAAGSGPVFEKIECAGFQGIPFFRRRFRTRNARTGKMTFIGSVLTRMRMSGLPQLINVVRGEMAIVGPQPVRMVFAEYLDVLSPLYTGRLLVKPGIFGWAQANGSSKQTNKQNSSDLVGAFLQEENMKMAYDFYYLQFGSPLVDFEILVRTLLGPRRMAKSALRGANA